MSRTVRLSGFRELEQALNELPKATARNVLRRIGKAALEPMADHAAALAPEQTGKLSFSIIVGEQRTRRAKRGALKRKDGVEIAMGPSAGLGVLQYATFAEFGTVDTPAQPYMRPAYDQGAEPALQYVETSLAQEIHKSAAKLARKRARAA